MANSFPEAQTAVVKLVSEHVKTNGMTPLTLKWDDKAICDIMPILRRAKFRSELACEGVITLFDIGNLEITFKAWEGVFK